MAGCAPGPAIPLDAVRVHVVAQRTTWRASYALARPEGDTVEVATGREIHVPIGASVTIALASGEYIADFAMPALGLHDFAAPGLPAELHFRATRAGHYDVRGAEMCGLPHDDRSRGLLIVEDADAYRAWVVKRARG
jgi:cytochrome c oxidase subunit 2